MNYVYCKFRPIRSSREGAELVLVTREPSDAIERDVT